MIRADALGNLYCLQFDDRYSALSVLKTKVEEEFYRVAIPVSEIVEDGRILRVLVNFSPVLFD